MREKERAAGEIALDESWLREMKQKAENVQLRVKNSKRKGILRVPQNILATKPEAYEPKLISLGPLHHHRLQQWDDSIKWPYLNSFLARNPQLFMEDYIRVLKNLDHEARSAYPEKLEMDSNKFTEMMLLDCCFLLEFLLVMDQKKEAHKPRHEQQQQEEEDPLASIGKWAIPLIRRDIFIFENQIPLFILRALSEKADIKSEKFEYLILSFFKTFSLFPRFCQIADSCINDFIKDPKTHHLLHLFHTCMMPKTMLAGQDDDKDQLPIIGCARELREAKVKLIKKEARSFLDISFEKPRFYDVRSFWSWRLEIPQLNIDDDSDTLFRNLIAFEQCFPDAGDHVAAYAWFMDSIVDSNADAALLRQRDIVVNGLGSDKDVAQLFNQLCREVSVDPASSYLGKVVNDVRTHCNDPRNKCWASLKHTYFSNPWAGIAVVAAVIIFVLTFLQTLYSILSYVKPK